jgi:hypothetical protein
MSRNAQRVGQNVASVIEADALDRIRPSGGMNLIGRNRMVVFLLSPELF